LIKNVRNITESAITEYDDRLTAGYDFVMIFEMMHLNYEMVPAQFLLAISVFRLC